MSEDADVIIRREGAAGIIRLNRPKALNALNLDMVRAIAPALQHFAADPEVALVLVEGAGERGLCAGGDIVGLYNSSREGGDLGNVFFREEYVVNAAIAAFPKPYVAYMDGIVMGGGVGMASHGRHRIVTEKTRLAMPETGIGFFPDVGGTWLLSRAPGEVGTFFALTAHNLGAADAIYARLADAMVETARWPELRARLCAAQTNIDHAAVRALIEACASAPAAGYGEQNREAIDRLFAHDSVEDIFVALQADGSDFAQAALKALRDKSPTSLKVTLRLLREARRSATLEECLVREYRASLQVFVSDEFREGVRAAVIDKDRQPKWSPSRIEDVGEEIVDGYFRHHGADDIKLEEQLRRGA
jgi:enoyl-CoA hydratase